MPLAQRKDTRRLGLWSMAALVVMAACSIEGDEITAYPLFCDTALVNNRCNSKAIPLNRTVYRVFPASQKVVEWTPGVSNRPVSLERCVIRDAENWRCSLPNDQGTVGFAGGEFKELLTPPGANQGSIFYVGAIRWWLNWLILSRF